MKIIQVAGTNGKGSVSVMLAQIFKEAGHRCGLYTSPHLINREERMRINGEKISPQDYDRLYAVHSSEPSVFAVQTKACMDWFLENDVDIAVMETGLGGRLDPVTKLLADYYVITSIGLDHMHILGNTVEEIAWEKAYAIKPGSTVVCYTQNKKSVQDIFESRCNEINASIEYTGGESPKIMAANAAAKMASKFGIDEIWAYNTAINTMIPARQQYIEKHNMIVDGGHNVDAISELEKHLNSLNKPYVLLSSMMADKDHSEMKSLSEKAEYSVATAVGGERASDLYEYGKYIAADETLPMPDAFYAAKKQAEKLGILLVVSGSFYLAGDVLHLIGEEV